MIKLPKATNPNEISSIGDVDVPVTGRPPPDGIVGVVGRP